jgi:hypothetical protein
MIWSFLTVALPAVRLADQTPLPGVACPAGCVCGHLDLCVSSSSSSTVQ